MASTRWRSERVSRLLQKYPTLRHVMVLVSGTAAAQIVAFAASLVTARLFEPEAFGQFAIYGSLTAIAITLASLRLDMTIMLPESDDAARRIARIATVSNVCFALASSVAALLLHNVIVSVYHDVQLANWLLLSGVTVFFVAQVNVLQYWFNRKTDYRTISLNRVQQMTGSAGGQVLFGAIGMRSLPGLIFGTLLGQAYAYFNLRRRSTDLRREVSPETPSSRQLMSRYKKMPLLNMPNAFVDSVRMNGIPLLVGVFGVSALGQFNLAWRILQVPIGLINSAVSQVFFQKLARAKPGEMASLVRYTMLRSFLIAIIPFGLIYVTSPWLFTLVFGAKWDMAGEISRALTPWLMMQLVTSPISTVFVVTENQGWMLVYSVFFAAAPLGLLYFSTMTLMTTLTWLGLLMAAMLVVQLLMALYAARRYDMSPPPATTD